MYHIIPDIHGQADKLDGLLTHLGWRRTPAGWHHPEPDRQIIFLGDFIDRGPDNARVINTVRSLMDSGKAQAVMGNHELNAIHFHTVSDATGRPLRERSAKNTAQHASFLAEFPLGETKTNEAITWMKSLPLYLETDSVRAVHACWHQPHIDTLLAAHPDARIDDDALHSEGWVDGSVWNAIDVLTKGVETRLPEGFSFTDKGGHRRDEVRIGWWLDNAKTWQAIARSIPEGVKLPIGALPAGISNYRYTDTKPVFFGHYWMTGTPIVEAPYALCLDYSAGAGGPLLAYDFDGGSPMMDAQRVRFLGD